MSKEPSPNDKPDEHGFYIHPPPLFVAVCQVCGKCIFENEEMTYFPKTAHLKCMGKIKMEDYDSSMDRVDGLGRFQHMGDDE